MPGPRRCARAKARPLLIPPLTHHLALNAPDLGADHALALAHNLLWVLLPLEHTEQALLRNHGGGWLAATAAAGAGPVPQERPATKRAVRAAAAAGVLLPPPS